MILSFIAIGLTVALIFFLPLEIFSITAVYFYSILTTVKVYLKKSNLLDWTIFAVYSFIAIANYIFNFQSIVPFTGSIFYSALTLICFLGAILGKPFTLSSKDVPLETLQYHRAMSVIMGVFYTAALLVSIFLFPRPIYIILPLVLTVIAVFAGIYGGKLYIFILHLKKRDTGVL